MTAHPLTLRDASASDLHAIVDLAMALGEQHAGYDPTRFELAALAKTAPLRTRYEQFFAEALADAASVLKVGERDGEMVGYTFGRIEPESFIDLADQSGWLHDVCVAQGARGAGVGPALITATLDALTARGARRLRLSVSPHNLRARRLFESLGFRATMCEMQRDV